MGLTYGAGALVAAARDDRRVWAIHKAALRHRELIVVPAVVLAQVWRDGARQARLSQLLAGCEVEVFGGEMARAVGRLLAASGTTDVVDAAVVIAATRRADLVVTSDPDDLSGLATALGRSLRLHAV
ncbi:MAG: twitching motility protein PilT [Actinobacteria bacterium]|nr:twitching motility protein PilT [Actinomycetota bacterium]MBI3686697.1 twitching motility protein PilT [Actinomycetota bacterium]